MTAGGCGCCEGPGASTPRTVAIRPGLDALSYRVGTHASFLATMKARLSQVSLSEAGSALDGRDRPLAALRTQAPDDPTVAFLDAWATVAEVLTFYNERIANEGFLRTATERRSVVELARLVGYRLRPGVAASVFLAFGLEQGYRMTIPAGMRAQSVPGPGETMESFETSVPLEARAEWSEMRPRRTIAPRIDATTARTIKQVVVKGSAVALRPGNGLLFVLGAGTTPPVLRFVASVNPQPSADPALQRTVVGLAPLDGPPAAQPANAAVLPEATSDSEPERAPIRIGAATGALSASSRQRPPIRIPGRTVQQALAPQSDPILHIRTTLDAPCDHDPVEILRRSPASERPRIEVVALPVRAAPFGHNAPPRPDSFDTQRQLVVHREWKVDDPLNRTGAVPPRAGRRKPAEAPAAPPTPEVHTGTTMSLDGDYDLGPETWLAVTTGNAEPIVTRLGAGDVARRSLAAYGLSGRSVRVRLGQAWITDLAGERSFERVRTTTVYAGHERLEPADVEDDTDLAAGTRDIELDDIYDGLEAGRWLIVSGEQILPNAPHTTGLHGSELVLLAGTTHDVRDNLGDTLHTVLHLVDGLVYGYKRATVTLYGNVVAATHGETRSEVLGSGDGARANQAFPLRQPPVTHVAAASADGAESTLEVTVNDVIWREVQDLSLLGPDGRGFVTRSEDDGTTEVVFGDGRRGARLPTGVENVKAVYRRGIGAGGNVRAGQISLLATRPLGVKSVLNPQAASGGADPDTRDQARTNAPLAVTALGRLVSVQDHEDFARTFAGIAKASAVRLSDGQRSVVHLTVAGVDDAPIDPSSLLYRNLRAALRHLGDPHDPVELAVRERLLLVVEARVKVTPDRRWETVEPAVRAALLDAFGFERRRLGQGVERSEVIAVMAAVPGVEYVDLETLRSISTADLTDELVVKNVTAMPATVSAVLARRSGAGGRAPGSPSIHPAQLLYLTPDIPDTLLLREITS